MLGRSGTLGVDSFGKAAPQLAFSAVLGALVAPLAAILPLVATGAPHDADCNALLAESRGLGAPL